MVDASRPVRVCSASSRIAAIEQSEWLLQLVSDRRRKRGHGEAASIRQMIATMVSDHGVDPAGVFVTGLSAGGAMTSVMLATYPEVFAGGAIIAGLPYGAATNVQQAFENMYRCPPRAACAWGDLIRQASSHKGPWPLYGMAVPTRPSFHPCEPPRPLDRWSRDRVSRPFLIRIPLNGLRIRYDDAIFQADVRVSPSGR